MTASEQIANHLHKVKGLKHKEIAKRLTKSTGENITWETSRTTYARACKRLREMEATLESVKGSDE